MCYGTMCWSCKSCDKQIRKKGPTGAWIFATWRIVQCAFRKKSVYKLRDQVSIQINTVRSHTRVCAVIFRLPNVNGVSDFNRLLGNGWCNLNYSNGGPFWPILDKMFFFFGRIFLSVMANPWNLQVKAPPGAPLDQKLTRDHTYQPKFCRKFSTVRLNLLTKYEECKKQIEIWRAL